MKRKLFAAMIAALGLVVGSVQAQPLMTTRRVIGTGLSSPIFLTSPANDTNRLFVVEQGGAIKIFDKQANSLLPNPYIRITGLSSTGGEQGLLGMAFHPDYANNGKFYVNLTVRAAGQLRTEIREYKVNADDPNKADASFRTLMTYNQPFDNHNGGWIGFGPNDGYLYIATGDGGSGGDPGNRSQDITDQKLGKILRIDVNTTGDELYKIPPTNPFAGEHEGDDEIWAYGLRNPWRNSFDRQTGDFYTGDVGQGEREEINFQAADSKGGENYGWKRFEGTRIYSNSTQLNEAGPLVQPIAEYNHSLGQAVTGGYVYRGTNIGGDASGMYFYADYVSGRVWSFRQSEGKALDLTERTRELRPPTGQGSIGSVSSFGEDSQGNLYLVSLGGRVYQLMAVPARGDSDLDGDVDLLDFDLLKENFGKSGELIPGDVDKNGAVNLADFAMLKGNFGKNSRNQDTPVPEPSALALLGMAGGVWWIRRKFQKQTRLS